MKFFRQVVLPFAIVLALIAGVTFVSHFTDLPNRTSQRVSAGAEPLYFQTTRASWDDQDPKYAKEFELDQPGHYDFWFRNPHPEAVQVTLKSSSDLALAMLPPADWGRHELGKAPVPAVWQAVAQGQPAAVPAAGEHAAEGVIRLSWRGTKPGLARPSALLELRRAGGAAKTQQLEVPVRFVAPVLAVPAPGTTDELELVLGGPPRSAEFLCWSATRPRFELAADAKLSDCFQVAWQALDAKDQIWLSENEPTRVRSGYRVTVSVSERAANQVLDLGRFEQPIQLAVLGTPFKITLQVAGVVRGPVRIMTPDAHERIDLKRYPRSQGKTEAVSLGVEPPVKDLRLASSPPGLQVALTKASAKRWQLQVQVPANGPSELNSAVILDLVGLERRWRIPVVGQGTQ